MIQSGIYAFYYKEKIAYVGSTNNIKLRYWQHLNRLRAGKHRNFIMQRIFNKNGNVFEHKILELCEVNILTEREDFYIKQLNPFANLGDAFGSHKHTEEDKIKMRGRIVSQETRNKLSEQAKGKPCAFKGKHFVTNTGKTWFEKGHIPANKGIAMSDEIKIKVSISKKKNPDRYWLGKTFSNEHREKLKIARKHQKPHSYNKVVYNSNSYESVKSMCTIIGITQSSFYRNKNGIKEKTIYAKQNSN